jgi:hypothetical protein
MNLKPSGVARLGRRGGGEWVILFLHDLLDFPSRLHLADFHMFLSLMLRNKKSLRFILGRSSGTLVSLILVEMVFKIHSTFKWVVPICSFGANWSQ